MFQAEALSEVIKNDEKNESFDVTLMVDEKASLNKDNFFEKNRTNTGDDKIEGSYTNASQEYLVAQTNDPSKAKLRDQHDEAIVGNTTSQTIALKNDIFLDTIKNQIQTDDEFTNGEPSGKRQENKSYAANQTNLSMDGSEKKNILNSLTDEEFRLENHGDIQENIKSQEILNNSIFTNISHFNMAGNVKNGELLKSSNASYDATQDSKVTIPGRPTDIVSSSVGDFNMNLANENLDQVTRGNSSLKNFEIRENKTSTFIHQVTSSLENFSFNDKIKKVDKNSTNNPHQKIYQNHDPTIQDQVQH
jgi:hypothetical protein